MGVEKNDPACMFYIGYYYYNNEKKYDDDETKIYFRSIIRQNLNEGYKLKAQQIM